MHKSIALSQFLRSPEGKAVIKAIADRMLLPVYCRSTWNLS